MARGRPVPPQNMLYTGDGSLTPIPDPTRLTTEAVSRVIDQFQRELAALREIFETRLAAIDEATRLHQKATDELPEMLERRLKQSANVLDARFAAIDGTVASHLKWSDEIRPQTERMIAHAAGLQDEKLASMLARSDEQFNSIDSKFNERNVWLHEKFDGLNKQFQERDVRTDQATRAAKDALDAALKAASELVSQQNTANVAAAAKSETSFTKQIDQIGTIISTLEKALDARITELKERIDRGEGAMRGSSEMRNEHRLDIAGIVQGIAVVIAFVTVLVILFSKK